MPGILPTDRFCVFQSTSWLNGLAALVSLLAIAASHLIANVDKIGRTKALEPPLFLGYTLRVYQHFAMG